jgi:hypothetical protein
MPLSPAEKQRKYRERQHAAAASRPEILEAALLKDAARAELSVDERITLADKLTNVALQHLWRTRELAAIAQKLRPTMHDRQMDAARKIMEKRRGALRELAKR